MKKLFTFIVGAAVGLGAYAQDFDSGGLYYTVLSPDDKTCAVTGHGEFSSDLVIPEVVSYEGEDYTVTEIGENVFRWNWISSLSLPSTLEVIGESAFWNCNGFRELVIPNSVKIIGSESFGACYDLSRLELGSSVEMIHSRAFTETPLAIVVATGESPAKCEYGYTNAFTSNPLVAVSENLVAAYQAAWEGANVVPNIQAESLAFEPNRYTVQPGGTVQLNCVANPANAPFRYINNYSGTISIDDNGLVTADNLRGGFGVAVEAVSLNGVTASCTIEIESLQEFNSNGFVFTVIPDAENEVALTRYESSDAVVNIPETVEYNGNVYSVTTIGPHVFVHKDGIEEVFIPASIKLIRESNFFWCSSLKNVTIADSATPLDLSNYNFTEANNLAEVYVGRNLIHSENATCFGWGIDQLSHIVLGPKVTALPDYLFRTCVNLNLVESKNPVPPAIGDWVFGHNYSFSIIVPAGSVEAYRSAWGQYASNIVDVVAAIDISFGIEEATLYNGQIIQLPLTVEPEDATVIWSSSNSNLVSVDRDGNVSYGMWTNEVGEATITASTINGLTAECKVIAKHWLTFSEDNVQMTPGSTYQVEVTKPVALANKPITWNSSNESVATVDDNGVISAVAFGDAEIYATVDVPINDWWVESRTYTINVEVRSEVISVEAVDPVISLWKENTAPINLVFNPDDEYVDRKMTWTVANPKIAEVYPSWNGQYNEYYVRGLEAGATAITGTTVNGKTVEIEVNVKAEIQDINFAKETIYLSPGESTTLEFTTVPEVTNQTFRFSSYNNNIASIDENGVITAHDFGSTEIEIWYESPWGENIWWRRVRVVVGIMPESVKLVGSTDIEGTAGAWNILQIEYTPNDDDICREIQWTIDNPEIGYFTSWGNTYAFRGSKLGSTAFRGVAANGDVLEGTITIAGIEFVVDGEATHSKDLNVGEELKLELRASSDNLLENVTFTSNNPEVATVTEDGLVTAVDYGRTQVIAMSTVDEKNYYADFDITVCPSKGIVFERQHVTLTPYNPQMIYIIRATNLDWSQTSWSSSNEDVVKIDWSYSEGASIYYVGPGTATITATDAFGNEATCEVTCLGNIDNVSFNTNKIFVAPGKTFQLEWTIYPEGSGQTITFASQNEWVATVDPETGLVTGVNNGETYIRAFDQNGRSWYVPVQVCNLPESVKFAGSPDYVGTVNQWILLQIEYTPNDNDIFREIQWTVDNPEIGYFTSWGYTYGFYGRNIGATAFRGVAANGDVLEGTITIEGITFVDEEGRPITSKEVEIGSETQLEVAASDNLPENAVYTYTSDNTAVATVSEDGVVTAVGPGVARITVKVAARQNGRRNIADGRSFIKAVTEVRENEWQNFEAQIQITVLPSEGIVFDNSEFTLSPYNPYGYPYIIRAKDVAWSSVTWESSDENVVALGWAGDYNAQLEYVGPGKATVTATDAFGNVATCEVTCVGRIESVDFNTDRIYVAPEKTFQLKYTIQPEGTGQTLTFRSGNEAIATVDSETGLVKGVAYGSTYIEATSQVGSYSKSVPVTVCNVPESVKLVGSTNYKGVINGYTPLQIKYTPNDDDVCTDIKWTVEDPEIGDITERVNETTHESEYAFFGTKLGTTAFKGVAANGDVLEGTFTNGLVFDRKEVVLTPGNLEYISVERFKGIDWAELTWESSDENVVTISMPTGYQAALNYKGAGEAEVKATDRNGYVAICKVIGTGILFTPAEVSMPTNSTHKFVLYDNEKEIPVVPEVSLIKVFPEGAETSSILWRTQDSDLVMVGVDGTMISKGATGKTKVFVTTFVNGYHTEASCDVTVGLPVTGITPAISANVAAVGTEVQLMPTVLPENAANKKLRWESSDKKIATVDENGLVTIHSDGSVAITAYSVENPMIFATFYFISFTAPDTSAILAEVGTEVQLPAIDIPDINWVSSDENVASVDENGVVSVHAEGPVAIAAYSAENPLNFATFYVIATDKTGVDGINEGEATFDIYNMNGILVKKNATAEDYELLERGFYIIKKGNEVIKVKH